MAATGVLVAGKAVVSVDAAVDAAAVLVIFHGGDFATGDKDDVTVWPGWLEAGIAVVRVNTRLSGQAPSPAQHADALPAVVPLPRLRPGFGLENWTSRTNYTCYGIIPTGPATMSFYIQRNYAQPSQYLQRLELRIDGFASINAGYSGGEFITKPLTFAGKELELNFATSAAGSVWVELQQLDGTTIPGFTKDECDEIIGDQIDRVVSWKGNTDVSAWAGKPVRLRFVMKDADLFAIRFRE
mgnify:CR=1 FL=1